MEGRSWLLYSLYIMASLLGTSQGTMLDSSMSNIYNQTSLFHLIVPEKLPNAQFNSPMPRTNTLQLLVHPTVQYFNVSVLSTKPDYISIAQGSLTLTGCTEENTKNTSLVQYSNSSQVEYNYNKGGSLTTGHISDVQICYNVSFQAYGHSLGYSTLIFYATFENTTDNEVVLDEGMIGSVVIACTRYYRAIDIAFKVSIYVLVATSLFGMGNEINWQVIKSHLKKPKAPAIALISQYTFMPSLALAIIFLMGYDGGYALGLFAYGCSPGGGMSNMYSRILKGDMSLSVTMTTLSTVASIGMMPLYLFTLGRVLPASEEIGRIEIPFLNIFLSLLAIILPLAIGALFQYKCHRASLVVRKFLKGFFFVIIIFFLTVGVYSNLYIYQSFNLSLIGSALILPIGGYLFGGLVAWACRMEWKIIKTISLETGLQNPAVAILVVQAALHSPESDLAIIPVLAASMVTSLPCLPLGIIYTIYQRCKKMRAKKSNSAEEGTIDNEDTTKELVEMNGDKVAVPDSADVEEKGELLDGSTSPLT